MLKTLVASSLLGGTVLLSASSPAAGPGGARRGQDTSQALPAAPDTTRNPMNADAIYARPLSRLGDLPIAIGGYAEANLQYLGTDGVTEGLSFQMRRANIFISSSIRDRITFVSEIEFEEGGDEIALETALLDIELTPLLVLRGGILLNPIGAFNQNHDGPKWEFIDRPMPATQLLPATWSNVGFGVHGRLFDGGRSYAYELYLTNSFDDRIIANEDNRTSLPASKDNPERFTESANGSPLVNAKVAFRERSVGEVGLSYMGGVYNTFEEDGIPLDEKRRVDVFAVDLSATVPGPGTVLTGELAFVAVDVPPSYTRQFGSRQWGAFLDIVQPLVKGTVFGFDRSVLSAAVRIEYVDWNSGTFPETGGDIGDDAAAVTPAFTWRPSSQTVVRLNYRYEWHTDLFGNPPSKTSGLQFGVATYF